MPSNRAAWLTAPKAKPLEVKDAPFPVPKENEIVIKNGAVAVNPIDWKLQEWAKFPMEYPTIIGQDVAGEVVEVGSSVSRFQKGDRVLGQAVGISSKDISDNAFQEYTKVLAHMASPITENLSFAQAVVLPLALSTAACGLFQEDYLKLQYPTLNPTPTGKTLLVWGGASGVGGNAIQLAVAAGYEVITTASVKNFDYVKKLGASRVFDYNSSTAVEDLLETLKETTVVGAFDAISSNGAFQNCVKILENCNANQFVATVEKVPEDPYRTVGAKWIFGTTLKDNDVSKAVYEQFLPNALAEGKYVVAPPANIVGHGLEAIQAGLEANKKGLSAQKVVITL